VHPSRDGFSEQPHGDEALDIPGTICLLDLRTQPAGEERYLAPEALDFGKLHDSQGCPD